MARLVQEAAAELEVLRMRAKRGPWEPPAVFSAVLVGKHLGHTGTVGTTQVEGDLCLVSWYVCAVDVYHLTTTGQPRGLSVRRHCWEAILNARGHS